MWQTLVLIQNILPVPLRVLGTCGTSTKLFLTNLAPCDVHSTEMIQLLAYTDGAIPLMYGQHNYIPKNMLPFLFTSQNKR